MKTIRTSVDHEAFRQDVLNVLAKHGSKLNAEEMLALLANMTGQMAAMMDQRKFTPQQVTDLIAENLQYGNKAVVSKLQNVKGPMQ